MQLTFSGHETFHCRHFWLKKGFDFIKQSHNFTDDSAVVHLGVGKNMVAAIRYWLRSFNILDQNDNLSELAEFLFSDKGKDPYLEDVASIWLLHYFLVTRCKASIYSLVFNEFRKERIEFTKEHLLGFLKRKCEENSTNFNERTVSNDINVFLKSYLKPNTKTSNIEDDFSGLLLDLELVDEFTIESSKYYRIESKDREDIPIELILFSILDNQQYGLSGSFNQLINDYNSVGMVYVLNSSDLMNKLSAITQKYDYITFTDDAGIKEIQFKSKPDKWKILTQYYDKN